MNKKAVIAISLMLLGSSFAWAVQPNEMLSDPALEARARALSAELRCLVCQNESIDESGADLARDLRLLIRERITQGESNAQVKDFLVSRYGDFILLNPPFKASTWLLWLSAPITLLLGIWAIFSASRRPRTKPVPLSAEEEKLLRTLDQNNSSKSKAGDN